MNARQVPIRPATVHDQVALGAVLARAFHEDPLWSWVLADEASRRKRMERMFRLVVNNSLRRGDTVLTDGFASGAAVWRPPKRWRDTGADSMRLGWAFIASVGRYLPRLAAVAQTVLPRHPKEPHWYLAVLGTDPARQGSGVGSALLREVTSRCDEEGLPAYLETESEENVAFYSRHGFVVRDEANVRKGPRLWFLWREPRELL